MAENEFREPRPPRLSDPLWGWKQEVETRLAALEAKVAALTEQREAGEVAEARPEVVGAPCRNCGAAVLRCPRCTESWTAERPGTGCPCCGLNWVSESTPAPSPSPPAETRTDAGEVVDWAFGEAGDFVVEHFHSGDVTGETDRQMARDIAKLLRRAYERGSKERP